MTKVSKISVKNLKAIGEYEAIFNGATCIIMGGNNKGKSSFIRSLPDRFRGIKPDMIVKENETEGFCQMELTDGVKLNWSFDNLTKKGERFSIIVPGVDEDGNAIETKSSITEEIMKRYFPASFDIDRFFQSMPKQQKQMIEKISGLDFSAINDRYKVAYDERTFANKKLLDAKNNLKPITATLPVKEIETMSIQKEISEMDLHNHKYENAQKGANDINRQITNADTEIKRLTTLLKAAEADKKQLEKRAVEANKWLDDKTNKPKGDDVSYMLNKKLQDAIDKNELIKKNNVAIKAKEDVLQLDIEAKKADKAVKAIELEKVEMIKKSKLPEGFDFTDDGVLYNNLPLTREQISSSAIYIAALKLASIDLGEVKMLHFDASFLDKNSLSEIEKWANEHDYQLLIERVSYEGTDMEYQILEDIQ